MGRYQPKLDVSTASTGYNSGETFTGPPTYSAGNYFGFELGYDKASTVGGASWSGLQYNGNIAGTIWKSVHDGQIRKYDFTYDAVNRLTGADFNQYTGGSFNKNAGINYTVNNLSYDANGNILSMNQFGLLSPSATSSNPIDLLSYTYISGTNKLQSVSDGANANTPAPGTPTYLGDYHYSASTGSAATYSYDANGNVTSDGNKGVSNIQYNYLNLPKAITASKGTIVYTYDAAGNKLQKQTTEGSTITTTTYMGGIVYQNDVLQFIPQEEGRIRVNSSSSGYIFDYYLKDHLGNTRMTITDDNTQVTPIIDATSYYPFGLVMKWISYNTPGSLENKYKFNGKEQQHNEFSDNSGLEWMDYGARMYDNQIGRFFTQDRFGEKYYSLTPYQYGANNPINNIDVNGDSIFVQIMVNAETREMQNYYYGQVGNKWGLVGSDGKLYSGDDKFAGQISGALDEIRTGGDFGAKFIGDAAIGKDNVEIHSYTGDNKTQDGILYVNPGREQSAPTEKGNQKIPFSLILGHEMAHGLANVQGVKFSDWTTVNTDENGGTRTLSSSEIHATHIENNLRVERGLPLRTYYSPTQDGGADPATRILDSKSRSLFYPTGDRSPHGTYKIVPADNRYIYRKLKQ